MKKLIILCILTTIIPGCSDGGGKAPIQSSNTVASAENKDYVLPPPEPGDVSREKAVRNLPDDARVLERISYASPRVQNEKGETLLATSNYGFEGIAYFVVNNKLYITSSFAGPFLVELENGRPYLTQLIFFNEAGRRNFTDRYLKPYEIPNLDYTVHPFKVYCNEPGGTYIELNRDNPYPDSEDYRYNIWHGNERTNSVRELDNSKIAVYDRGSANGPNETCSGDYFYFEGTQCDAGKNNCRSGIFVYDLKYDKIYDYLTRLDKERGGVSGYASDPVAIPNSDYIFYIRHFSNESGIRYYVKRKFARPE